MTVLWRISAFDDLKGLGGETYTARWHTAAPGKRIVYLAEHPALALIEVLVNTYSEFEMPERYQLLKIAVAGDVSTELLSPNILSKRWRDHVTETQFIGDSWLAEGRSALLGVPSAPSPESLNYLFNPLHTDARRLTIEWHRWIEYDERLYRTRSV